MVTAVTELHVAVNYIWIVTTSLKLVLNIQIVDSFDMLCKTLLDLLL